jgi:hypothetical protein
LSSFQALPKSTIQSSENNAAMLTPPQVELWSGFFLDVAAASNTNIMQPPCQTYLFDL